MPPSVTGGLAPSQAGSLRSLGFCVFLFQHIINQFCSQNEARKLNHQEVVEEDKRLKLPANWEAKKARLEWQLQVEEKKKVNGQIQLPVARPSPHCGG